MKFLIDEDVSYKLASFLKELGHTAIHIREIQISLKDRRILSIAVSGEYIIVTEDKDFGELVFKEKQKHTGVILLRLEDQTVPNTKKVINWLLEGYINHIYDNFAVITEKEGKFYVRFGNR